MRKIIRSILCVLFVSSFLSFQANASENKGCTYEVDGEVSVSGPFDIIDGYRFIARCDGYIIHHKDGTSKKSTEEVKGQKDSSDDMNEMEEAKKAAKAEVYTKLEEKRKEACKNKGCEGK